MTFKKDGYGTSRNEITLKNHLLFKVKNQHQLPGDRGNHNVNGQKTCGEGRATRSGLCCAVRRQQPAQRPERPSPVQRSMQSGEKRGEIFLGGKPHFFADAVAVDIDTAGRDVQHAAYFLAGEVDFDERAHF